MKIAFDVDDTLIIPAVDNLDNKPHPYIGVFGAVPNYEVISIYKWFQSQGHHMVVWSGGGIEYATVWADKLGLKPDEVILKEKSSDIDICFDDMDVDLAKINIKVKRKNL